MQRPLEAAQRAGTAEKRRVASAFAMWAIVAAEDDEGIFLKSEFAQPNEQPAHFTIEIGDERRVVLHRLWPFLVGIGSVARRLDAVFLLTAALVVDVRRG